MTKISVIIPVYNTAKYLTKCLDSVCSQTLKDIEVICINDCSTDNSLEILQNYAANDNRIKIINFTENKGAAAARNHGIDIAQGEYLGFIDSDDFVDLDFYEKLYNKAKETGAEVVKGNYKYLQTNTIDYEYNKKIIDDKNNFSFGYCSAIFDSSLIRNNKIKFPNLCDMEDPVFAFYAAIKANAISIVDSKYVNIITRPDSQTAGIPSLKQIKDKFRGINKMIKIANGENIPKKSYIYTFVLWITMIFEKSLLNKELYVRKFLVKNILNCCDNLKYREAFFEKLMLKNEFLAKSILDKKIDNLLNYEQIYYIRKNLKNGH